MNELLLIEKLFKEGKLTKAEVMKRISIINNGIRNLKNITGLNNIECVDSLVPQ